MSFSHIIDIADLRQAAKRKLPRPIFDYLDGGAEDSPSRGKHRVRPLRLQAPHAERRFDDRRRD